MRLHQVRLTRDSQNLITEDKELVLAFGLSWARWKPLIKTIKPLLYRR